MQQAGHGVDESPDFYGTRGIWGATPCQVEKPSCYVGVTQRIFVAPQGATRA